MGGRTVLLVIFLHHLHWYPVQMLSEQKTTSENEMLDVREMLFAAEKRAEGEAIALQQKVT